MAITWEHIIVLVLQDVSNSVYGCVCVCVCGGMGVMVDIRGPCALQLGGYARSWRRNRHGL